MFTLGSLLSLSVSLLYTSDTQTVTNVVTSSVQNPSHKMFDFSGYRISSYMRTPDGQLSFEIDKDGQRKTSMELWRLWGISLIRRHITTSLFTVGITGAIA